MVGFIADYAGGEIKLQEEELSSGDFYKEIICRNFHES